MLETFHPSTACSTTSDIDDTYIFTTKLSNASAKWSSPNISNFFLDESNDSLIKSSILICSASISSDDAIKLDNDVWCWLSRWIFNKLLSSSSLICWLIRFFLWKYNNDCGLAINSTNCAPNLCGLIVVNPECSTRYLINTFDASLILNIILLGVWLYNSFDFSCANLIISDTWFFK